MDDFHNPSSPELVALEKYLNAIEGVEVTNSSIAPHCRIHYFHFKATDEALKKLVVFFGKQGSFISVRLRNDEIIYDVGIHNYDIKKLLE